MAWTSLWWFWFIAICGVFGGGGEEKEKEGIEDEKEEKEEKEKEGIEEEEEEM